MIKFACTDCGQTLKVKPEYAGRPTNCPACGAGLVTPIPTTASERHVGSSGSLPARYPRGSQTAVQRRPEAGAGKAPCPLCGAPVNRGALKCPTCKSAIGSVPFPACREPVPATASVCPHCQTVLRSSNGPSAPPQAPNIVVQQSVVDRPRRRSRHSSIIVLERKSPFNHTPHMILTLLTGVWLIVRIVLYAQHENSR